MANWKTNNYSTVHILPDISRRKDNQKMRFGQLREYNMRKNFLESIMQKMWWRN